LKSKNEKLKAGKRVKLTNAQRANIRSVLFHRFLMLKGEPGVLADILADWSAKKKKFIKAESLIRADLRAISRKSIYRQYNFKASDARVKKQHSMLVKMFNYSWERAGFDRSWPKTDGKVPLNKLMRSKVLWEVYGNCSDMVGGRMIVSTVDDISTCIDVIADELRDRNYRVCGKSEYRDYVQDPKQGYYAIHIYVEVPIGKRRGKRIGPYVPAEIQIQSLVGHAWSEVGHDTIYKGVAVPGTQIFTKGIVRTMEQLGSGLKSSDHLFGELREQVFGKKDGN